MTALVATTTETVNTIGLEAERRWKELDAAARLPDDLQQAALDGGLFRTLVPVELGGVGGTPTDWFRIGVELARHEPSVAWVVTQGAAELGWIAAGGNESWARELLEDPLGASASSVAGVGKIVLGEESTLEGRWGFNSGAHGATWIGGLSVVADSALPDGAPDIRFGWVPADRAEIVEDWDPIGMRGSGSHSTVIRRQEIDPRWVFSPFEKTANDRGPYRCVVGNGNWPITGSVAATQLGAARRAIDEAERLAHEKIPAPEMVRLADMSTVQRALICAEGRWNAARAGVERELELMWEQANGPQELSREQRLRLFAANAHADNEAVRIVNDMCEITGTAAINLSSPLARMRRDSQALHGHLGTNGAAIEHAGKVKLGLLDEHRRV